MYYLQLANNNGIGFKHFDSIIIGSALHTLSNEGIRKAAKTQSTTNWESRAIKRYKEEMGSLIKVYII